MPTTQIYRFISLLTGEAFAMEIPPDMAQELITRGVVRLAEDEEEAVLPKAIPARGAPPAPPANTKIRRGVG